MLSLEMLLNNNKYIIKLISGKIISERTDQIQVIQKDQLYFILLYNLQIDMQKSTQLKKQTKNPQFVKGMTLDQYLSNFPAFLPVEHQTQTDQKQENLYESSHYGLRKRMQSKNNQFGIQEIDQESIEDSVEYEKPGKTRATPFFQHLQLEEVGEEQLNLANKKNRISLNSRQNFKNSSLDKNSFRVKKMSMSPSKRKNEQVITSGSVTLYGNKFGMAKKKQESKIPELLTFYGKLSLQQQQVKMNPKSSWKGDDIKQNFKKKNHLQLKQLLMMQNKIRNSRNLGINDREMMVLGVKDKLNQRRSRHI